jgi:hypothetical protein
MNMASLPVASGCQFPRMASMAAIRTGLVGVGGIAVGGLVGTAVNVGGMEVGCVVGVGGAAGMPQATRNITPMSKTHFIDFVPHIFASFS